MSATVQRRDIFDPSIVSGFAESVGTLERLQRLTLLTYADIHAVHPEALTRGKRKCCGSFLWRLQPLQRTLDRNRLHASDEIHARAGSGYRENAKQPTLSVSWKDSRGGIWRYTPRRKSRGFCVVSEVERRAPADRVDA